jgi:beta-glucanase (GH16 family)
MNRKETALLMMQEHGKGGKKTFTNKFKGDCQICGKKVYKDSDCWENLNNKGKKLVFNNKPKSPKNTNNNREKLKCSYYGKDNHTVEKCFKRFQAESSEIA